MTSDAPLTPAAARLKRLIEAPGLRLMPCCFDALSARLVERAGFPLTFLSGFATAAARHGLPDAGLLAGEDMAQAGRQVTAAVGLPVIGDGDTGYGGPMNVRRTVDTYARAGFAGILIEDQVWPKRCGHVAGKDVVGRDEALVRLRAALDARDGGAGILVLARTDARGPLGFDEAMTRARAFAAMGADIVFLEAPESEAELAAFAAGVDRPAMANLLEDGRTPLLPPDRLEALGFKIAAYPLTLLAAAAAAMERALDSIKAGRVHGDRVRFGALCDVAGFPDHDRERARYALAPSAFD